MPSIVQANALHRLGASQLQRPGPLPERQPPASSLGHLDGQDWPWGSSPTCRDISAGPCFPASVSLLVGFETYVLAQIPIAGVLCHRILMAAALWDYTGYRAVTLTQLGNGVRGSGPALSSLCWLKREAFSCTLMCSSSSEAALWVFYGQRHPLLSGFWVERRNESMDHIFPETSLDTSPRGQEHRDMCGNV